MQNKKLTAKEKWLLKPEDEKLFSIAHRAIMSLQSSITQYYPLLGKLDFDEYIEGCKAQIDYIQDKYIRHFMPGDALYPGKGKYGTERGEEQ